MLFSFRSSGKACSLIRQYLDRDLKEISQTRKLGVGKTFQVENAVHTVPWQDWGKTCPLSLTHPFVQGTCSSY